MAERWDNDPTAPGGMDPSFRQVFEGGQNAGAKEEREAVVRWLRLGWFYKLADQIEAGEHRKEDSRG